MNHIKMMVIYGVKFTLSFHFCILTHALRPTLIFFKSGMYSTMRDYRDTRFMQLF